MKRTLIAASFALILSLGFSPRILLAGNAAQSPGCAPGGGLNFLRGVHNPEDLVLVPNTRWMLASGMAPGSGLHLVDTQAKAVKNVYAADLASTRPDRAKYANCPGALDPKLAVLHGLSLRPAQAGRYTVYA